MKFTGSATLHAPAQQVWDALNDPGVLARTIPGCERLEETAPNTYRVTVSAGVASIKGTYQGDVAMVDQEAPHLCTLQGSGSGAPGTVDGECRVRLQETDGVTTLRYDAEAVVGGAIGGVGQRVLTGVSKKMAAQFFSALDDVLTGKAAAVPAQRAEPVPAEALPDQVGAATVYSRVAEGGGLAGAGRSGFVTGAVFGAIIALAGVAVGGFVARSRQRS